MKKFYYKGLYYSISGIFFLLLFTAGCQKASLEAGWPEINRETKPWTRWWWLGNSIQSETLPEVMEQYKQAGLGGLEITPIYGVKGYEEQFVDFLSPQWVDLLESTLRIADSMNIGIDLANASGWPFGGPWIGPEHACKRLVYKKYHFSGGQEIKHSVNFEQEPLLRAVRRNVSMDDIQFPISKNDGLQKLALAQVRFPRKLPLVSLMAYSNTEKIVELTDKVNENGDLNWDAPAGEWEVYAFFQGWHGKMVERASPGGEGNVIDHFSVEALYKHLQVFDSAFSGKNLEFLRAFFNDSYEVDDADGESDFTPEFFEVFQNLRGYDLRLHFPALLSDDNRDYQQRVLCDYRETISDLLLEEFTIPWKNWAHDNDAIIRNQAHGSPANILDLYAASDIPETESTDLMRIKFASSASHVSGKKLTSAEACTWLDEHFHATLGKVKENIDRFFLGGVNHIFYHGTTYSPPDEKWPGWLFYAAVHFDPVNPFWNDFKSFNQYVTCCQSFLQTGKPDNDILIYFPIYDRWSKRLESGILLDHMSGAEGQTTARNLAIQLYNHGYSFDFISDKQILNLTFNKSIVVPNGKYQSIIIPKTNFIPFETINYLQELARKGANIIFLDQLPQDIPGWGNLENRRQKYFELKANINFSFIDSFGNQNAEIGKGAFYITKDISTTLSDLKIKPEFMVNDSLAYIRRKLPHGASYFILNRDNKKVDKWIPLNKNFSVVVLYNPLTGQFGKAASRKDGSVYLQLNPGESCILETFDQKITVNDYPYMEEMAGPITLNGKWKIEFIEGGPELPPAVVSRELKPWTEFEGEEYKRFSGTASYKIFFEKPEMINNVDALLLDLGKVYESAEVILNGKKLGHCLNHPYVLVIDINLLDEINELDVKVSNLMSNRIAWMDKMGINWKKFYDINFPAKKEENVGEDGLFNAAAWKPFDSGLEGPVRLTPLKFKNF